jgi:hypothetical protein
MEIELEDVEVLETLQDVNSLVLKVLVHGTTCVMKVASKKSTNLLTQNFLPLTMLSPVP